MEVIHVGLYGGKGIFGGRETKLEASVISCDQHQSCSLFKNNQCVRVRSFGDTSCKYGREETVTGFTSKAKKYHGFRSEWKNHEAYGKLTHPPDKLGVMGDFVYFPYAHVRIRETQSKELQLVQPATTMFTMKFIERKHFNVEFIHRLCTFKPQAMMGGEITSYQKEVVPLFLAHLKEVLPELHAEFLSVHPECAREVNYVGRKALLTTVKPSFVEYTSRDYPDFNETWEWDGVVLTHKGGYVHKVKVIKDYEVECFKIIPNEKAVVTITDNDQVDEQTVFVD